MLLVTICRRERSTRSDAIIWRVKVGIPQEITEGERRVGLVPETVGRLIKDGFEVIVESGAGRDYNLDANYEEAGATVVDGAEDVYGEADIIVKVQSPTEDEIGLLREGQVLICFLNGPQEPELVERLAEAGVDPRARARSHPPSGSAP
jgi:H+-translocating NAD(P) transhydrogenase subunit alpha